MITMKNIKKETIHAGMDQLSTRGSAPCFHQIPRNSIPNVGQLRGTSPDPHAPLVTYSIGESSEAITILARIMSGQSGVFEGQKPTYNSLSDC